MPRRRHAAVVVVLLHLLSSSVTSTTQLGLTNHIFIKTPKCASSTAGGIARRLAAHANMSSSRSKTIEPKIFANHIERWKLDGHTDVMNLRLPVFPRWTILRDPAERALSEHFFFKVKGEGAQTTDKAILHSLRRIKGNYMFKYVSPATCMHLKTTESAVECVLDAYDFVGVAELFDESMLQLAALVDAPLASILYLSSKVGVDQQGNSQVVDHSVQGQSAKVRKYVNSNNWFEKHALDYKLWEAAYRRVANQTIGHEDQLGVYRDMLADVAGKCPDYEYDNDQDKCYWHDNGCGFPCFDSMYGN